MAFFYWVGASNNWDDSNGWASTSGGTPGVGLPNNGDSIFFDSNSSAAPVLGPTTSVALASLDFNGCPTNMGIIFLAGLVAIASGGSVHVDSSTTVNGLIVGANCTVTMDCQVTGMSVDNGTISTFTNGSDVSGVTFNAGGHIVDFHPGCTISGDLTLTGDASVAATVNAVLTATNINVTSGGALIGTGHLVGNVGVSTGSNCAIDIVGFTSIINGGKVTSNVTGDAIIDGDDGGSTRSENAGTIYGNARMTNNGKNTGVVVGDLTADATLNGSGKYTYLQADLGTYGSLIVAGIPTGGATPIFI